MKLLLFLLLHTMYLSSCQPVSDNKKLKCLNNYIEKIKTLPVYDIVRTGVVDSLKRWKELNLNVRFFNSTNVQLDSAVFFNNDYSRCILLMIEGSPPGQQYKWNFVQTLGAEKINGQWHYYHVAFPTLSYSLKNNNYKDFDFDYLSKDARLDIINRGFFKEGSCKIDPAFVDSEEWIADWVREKHKLFLKGR